jgi:hypothetical protein
MFVLIAPRQFPILVGRLARFLDESVKQNHSAFPVYVEQYARDSVLCQERPHFANAVAQRLANGHSDRPAELDGFDVLADAFPVVAWKPSQSISHGFSSCLCAIEDRQNSLALVSGGWEQRIGLAERFGLLVHQRSVPYKVH